MDTISILYLYIFLMNMVFSLTCPENEVEDKCPTYCPSESCPTEPKRQPQCPSNSGKCGPSACKCRFNYSRAKNGTCIPTASCPPFQCSRPNEEYNPCPPLCPSDDCSQATPNGKCPLPGRIDIVVPCQPDCRCKKNYWRKDGVCVPYRNCYEEFSRTTFAHAKATGDYVSTVTYSDSGSRSTRAYSYSHASS